MSVCVISALFPLAILERYISAYGVLAMLVRRPESCAAAQTEDMSLPELILMSLAETRRSLLQASRLHHSGKFEDGRVLDLLIRPLSTRAVVLVYKPGPFARPARSSC
jgi:hypothetical protein